MVDTAERLSVQRQVSYTELVVERPCSDPIQQKFSCCWNLEHLLEKRLCKATEGTLAGAKDHANVCL